MYKELIFSDLAPSPSDAYAGGGARMPISITWPTDAEGKPLSHLLSVPGYWLSNKLKNRNYWISIFIPYIHGEGLHYRKLQPIDGRSEAIVIGYQQTNTERNHNNAEIFDCGRIYISETQEIDDDENLASKLDGVDAWLQSKVYLQNCRRRISIYGGDLDISLPRNKGILSDGMGYLFLYDDFTERLNTEIGAFFLQLG